MPTYPILSEKNIDSVLGRGVNISPPNMRA